MCCWVRTRLPLDAKWVWPIRSRAHDCVDMRLQPCRPVGLGSFSFCESGISGAKQNADVVSHVQVDQRKEKKTTAMVLLIFSLIRVINRSSRTCEVFILDRIHWLA